MIDPHQRRHQRFDFVDLSDPLDAPRPRVLLAVVIAVGIFLAGWTVLSVLAMVVTS